MSGTDVASNVIVARSNLLHYQIHVDLSVATSYWYLQIHYCKLNVVSSTLIRCLSVSGNVLGLFHNVVANLVT